MHPYHCRYQTTCVCAYHPAVASARLAIDLGTSHTVGVVHREGQQIRPLIFDGSPLLPSGVALADDGTLVTGRDAQRIAQLWPDRYEPHPKRRVDEGTLLLGDVVVPVTEALGAVLRRVADETSRQLGGAKPDEVRLTHPAQWGPVRRNVLLAAARLAGMGTTPLILTPEQFAAMIKSEIAMYAKVVQTANLRID